MSGAELLLDSMYGLPLGNGTFHAFYGFASDDFGEWGILTPIRSSLSAFADIGRIKRALHTSSALYTGTLDICYTGTDYQLFGHPHGQTPTRSGREPALQIMHRIDGLPLESIFNDHGNNTWGLLATIDQSEYNMLLLQLRLAREEGHSTDLEHRNNIMIRNPLTPGPMLNIIDLGYNHGAISSLDNRPELLIRLFFPEVENGNEPHAVSARQQVLEKLMIAAEAARLGTTNNIGDIAELLKFSEGVEEPIPSCLTHNQREMTAAILYSLPRVESTDRVRKPRLPQELKALSKHSLRESAESLREWLEAIHSSGIGRGLNDFK